MENNLKSPEIAFEIYTLNPTIDWKVGKRLLTFITEFDDRLIPQTLDNWGIKHDFKSVEASKPYWAPEAVRKGTKDNYYYHEFNLSIGLKRRRVVNYETELKHTSMNRKGRLTRGRMRFSAQYHKAIEWEKLFLGICDILGSNTALLHYFGQFEKRWSLVGGVNFLNISHHFLVPAKYVQEQRKGFAYYIEEDLIQKIRDHGFSIDKLNDGYLIKVTENLQDMIDDFESFAKRRNILRSLFPKGVIKG